MKISRTANRVIEEATDRMFGRRIRVEQACTYGAEKPAKYNVNWSCCGAQSAGDALAYAKKLVQAAQIAQMLTSMELIEGRDMESPIKTKEAFEWAVERVQKMFGTDEPQMMQEELEHVLERM